MRAYRIVKHRHAAEAFTGEGARIHGGRWNFPGVPLVYAAQTRSLAAIEALAHFHGAERRIRFVTFEIEIPDRLIAQVDASSLPAGWRTPVISSATQEIGSRWQRSGSSVALAVPSVPIPQEFCILLNPEHADTDKVMVSYPEPFSFDERL